MYVNVSQCGGQVHPGVPAHSRLCAAAAFSALAAWPPLAVPNIMWAGTASPGSLNVVDTASSLRLPPPACAGAPSPPALQSTTVAARLSTDPGCMPNAALVWGAAAATATPEAAAAAARLVLMVRTHPVRAAMTFCSCDLMDKWLRS